MPGHTAREDAAAVWFAKADRGPLTADDRKAFLEWLEAPGNAEAYQETADAWSVFGAAKGAHGFLLKPFSDDQMVQSLQELMA